MDIYQLMKVIIDQLHLDVIGNLEESSEIVISITEEVWLMLVMDLCPTVFEEENSSMSPTEISEKITAEAVKCTRASLLVRSIVILRKSK